MSEVKPLGVKINTLREFSRAALQTDTPSRQLLESPCKVKPRQPRDIHVTRVAYARLVRGSPAELPARRGRIGKCPTRK